MKNLYSTLIICLLSSMSFAQVSFTVLEPASVAGGYEFTSNGDGTNWGLPDLLDPLDAVLDTCVLVDDGTPGINAQGVPFANEGCGTLNNDLTSKIAVVYRYDGVSANVCWYGTKVLMAEQAGAIGVIMINRDDALIDVPGTTDGPLTSIPFAFISKTDGALLRARMDAGDDVIAFIGSKLGLYGDDLGIIKQSTLAPSSAAIASQTSLDGTEFGFDIGTTIYNYGQNTQSNVMLTATVTGPAGTWTETTGPYTILSGDTIDVSTDSTNTIPAFSFTNYPDGVYTLDYNIDLGILDESDFDNNISYSFSVSDSIVSYCKVDPSSNLPVTSRFTGSVNADFSTCMVYNNPNGSRLAAEGMYFSATPGWDTGIELDGEEITLTLYQWDDVFTDLNDPAFDVTNLSAVAFGFYYYVAGLDSTVVFGSYDTPVQLADNQRYLACINANTNDIWFGFNNKIDYTRNIDAYLQPLFTVEDNTGFYGLGFGPSMAPAIALRVFDSAELGIDVKDELQVSVYPNPSSEILNVSLNNQAHLTITDLSGRIIKEVDAFATVTQIDVSMLNRGQYLLIIESQNGIKKQHNFTKL